MSLDLHLPADLVFDVVDLELGLEQDLQSGQVTNPFQSRHVRATSRVLLSTQRGEGSSKVIIRCIYVFWPMYRSVLLREA